MEFSLDLSAWRTVIEGTLANVDGLACNEIELQRFEVQGGEITARFMKLNALSPYSTYGVGFQYVTLEYQLI